MCVVMPKVPRRLLTLTADGALDEADAALPIVSPALPDFSQWGPVATEPLRSLRKATARQMALAWSQIPHVSNQGEADVTALEALRKRHASSMAKDGGRLTLTVFAVKAAVAALKRFPRFNASLDMAGEQIIYKQYYHVGVAVDSPRGLIVPILRDVDRKSIRELALEFPGMVARARDGKTTLEELQGGTFTITNAGAVGGGHFAPIINFPQVAILGMGRAVLKPVVRPDAEGASGNRAPSHDAAGVELRSPHRGRGRGHPPDADHDRHPGRSGSDGIGFLRCRVSLLEAR
jgi:pyruvate dehydrogenase E2 component (dihydrolipoamide acetyltransferase)